MLEIDPEVDFDSRRAVYFRQMRYGLFVCNISVHGHIADMENLPAICVSQVRMALLASVMG